MGVLGAILSSLLLAVWQTGLFLVIRGGLSVPALSTLLHMLSPACLKVVLNTSLCTNNIQFKTLCVNAKYIPGIKAYCNLFTSDPSHEPWMTNCGVTFEHGTPPEELHTKEQSVPLCRHVSEGHRATVSALPRWAVGRAFTKMTKTTCVSDKVASSNVGQPNLASLGWIDWKESC